MPLALLIAATARSLSRPGSIDNDEIVYTPGFTPYLPSAAAHQGEQLLALSHDDFTDERGGILDGRQRRPFTFGGRLRRKRKRRPGPVEHPAAARPAKEHGPVRCGRPISTRS